MKTIIQTAFALWMLTTSVMSQKGIDSGTRFGLGEDSIRCLTNLSLYTEYYKQKNYTDAFPFWEIAFNECPLATMNLYVNGAVIIKNFLDKETDLGKKEVWFQYLMKVYDQRIQYFGNHAKYPADYINGVKAMDMLRYKSADMETKQSAHTLMQTSINNRGAQSQAALLMQYLSNTVSLFSDSLLKADEVVDVYLTVNGIFEEQLAGPFAEISDSVSIVEQKNGAEQLFISSGVANCDLINQIYAPQFDANKTNLVWLKRVSALMIRQECESELEYKVSESLHQLEPSANSALGMAMMNLKNKETSKAIDYYKQAIELETNKDRKAAIVYKLGLVYMSYDNFSAARTQFVKATELRSGWGKPYIQIGLLYALSASKCGADDFEHKTVYWAAVDKFIKAKVVDPSVADEANRMIATYSAHFPGKEELFFLGMNDGDAYSTGCWINETTTVRSKQ